MSGDTVHITTINGKPLPFTRYETQVLYRSPYYLGTLFVFLVLMVVLRPGRIEYGMSNVERVSIWLFCIVLYSSALHVLANLAVRLSERSGLHKDVPTWLLHALLLPPITVFVHWGVERIFLPAGTDYAATWGIIARNYLIVLTTEAAIVLVVFPRLAPPRKARPTDGQAGRLAIKAGPNAYFLDQVVLIKSVEHYLEIETTTGKQLLRMRLADILSQVGEADGVQPHRSYWVPGHAIAGLRRDGAKTVLVLNDGRTVPVARSRVADVKRWIGAHQPQPHTGPSPSQPA